MSAAASASVATPAAAPAEQKKDVQTQVNDFLALLDAQLGKYNWAKQLQEKTQVRPAYFACAAAGAVLAFVLFGFGASAVCNLVGFIYPLYASFKALKTADQGDDTQWLTYWIVFGWFSFVESFTDILLRWIPFYYVFKVAFLIWAFLPSTQGAQVVYKKFLCPIFLKHERNIDAALDLARARAEGEGAKTGAAAGAGAAAAAPRKLD